MTNSIQTESDSESLTDSYEINSLNNKIVDLEKVNDNLKKNNNILTEKIENIKKIAN